MPVYLEIQDLNRDFRNAKNPIIVNDLASRTEEDREYFNELVNQTFTNDIISMLPSCKCGETKGEDRVGDICEECEHPVRQTLEHDIAPSVWFRKPEGIESLISPIVWILLSKRFKKGKFLVMNWLTDRNYRSPTVKIPEIVTKMEYDGIPRGWNNFINHFDEILEYLFAQSSFKIQQKQVSMVLDMLGITHPSKDPLQQLIQDNRDKIFCDYIPMLNRTMLVVERNVMGIFADNTIFDIKDVLNTMLSIDQDFYDKSSLVIENRTAKIQAMLGEYYYKYFHNNLSPKEGTLRKHVYGGRLNHAFRAVITSHESIHRYNELWIPWSVGVTVLRLHIKNRLLNRKWMLEHYGIVGGFTNNEADDLIYGHVGRYHPLLDAIMQDLIEKCKPKYIGIPVMMHRNHYGSLRA